MAQEKDTEKLPQSVIYGAPEGQDARILADRAREAAKQQEIICHIALDDGRLEILKDLLAFFAPDVQIIEFPAWDCLPYDRVSPNPEISSARMATLAALAHGWDRPSVILTTIASVLALPA